MTNRPRLTPAMANARRMVREALQLEGLKLAPGSKLLLAVSGGGDSMALAQAAAFEAPRLDLVPLVVIIDHQLQENSASVAEQAKQRCEALGLSAEIVKVEVKERGQGLEAAAREARYQALEQTRLRTGASLVLLGHNLEDQAESVLLGLTRGSGLRSISGMPTYDPERKLLRPFLELSRAELRQACADQGVEYWDDPHNQEPRFTRVRIRNWLEQLELAIGPGIPAALSRTAQLASLAEDFLVSQAQDLVKQARHGGSASEVSYRVTDLAKAHPALLGRTIQLIATQAGGSDVSMAQVNTVCELVTNWHGQKMLQLSGITVERVDDLLVFKTKKPLKPGAC